MKPKKKKSQKKVTMSQKGVNVVNLNAPFEAKVVFKKTVELHETSKFVELHDSEVISKFVAMIDELSIILPVVIDEKCNVLAGNVRLIAAQRLNLVELPTVRAELLTSQELMDFSFQSMQVAQGWGLGINFLEVELKELQSIGLKATFLVENGDEENGITTI